MPDVIRYGEIDHQELTQLLANYQLEVCEGANNAAIPGSFWGDEEAGLVRNKLHLRADTPLHSALHEACHYICMDAGRRSKLDTNAGGDSHEENAVCYLQILLSQQLSCMGREKMLADMDAWGYSFRLGSSKAWFENDAEDARDWLIDHGIIDSDLQPTFKCRI
ncbi:MAG: hypothetical protein OEY09_18900 [Gammaproteobacteria bacterium]|nr:hypothetical protein [Gammaproteobacteria bacterium]